MASSKDSLAYVLDLLGDAECISHRAMMGEYVLYTCGKVFGGIYDDRFLVKPTEVWFVYQLPHDGAKPMLPVDTENRCPIRTGSRHGVGTTATETLEVRAQETPEEGNCVPFGRFARSRLSY